MEFISLVNNYWPVIIGVGGLITWLAGINLAIIALRSSVARLEGRSDQRDRDDHQFWGEVRERLVRLETLLNFRISQKE